MSIPSKSRLRTIGSNLRNGCETKEDIDQLNEWRRLHLGVINTFKVNLRKRAEAYEGSVATRLKRLSTIRNKLKRHPTNALPTMQDIAGCRVIFPSIAELEGFRNNWHSKRRAAHVIQHELGRYDYVTRPKESGYRGVHDVYKYKSRDDPNHGCNGLQVEIQYRTAVQHAWATAVEILDLMTRDALKFSAGDERMSRAMVVASEILARAYEGRTGALPEAEDRELVGEFKYLDGETNLTRILRSAKSMSESTLHRRARYAILLVSQKEQSILLFKSSKDATLALFEQELEREDSDLVLVSATDPVAVRNAFRNYFRDSDEFLRLLGDGLEKIG